MADNQKYYYIYVFYDIGEPRVNKIFKVCKKYLNHVQNSVFEGEITPANIILLEKELKEIMVLEEDIVIILKLRKKEYIEETVIGNKEDNCFI